MKNLSSDWKKVVPEEEREEFKGRLQDAEYVLSILEKILRDKYDESMSRMRDRRRYGSSNWSHSMADEMGTQRTLESIINLIKADKA